MTGEGERVADSCDEADRLWAACVKAAIDYRDAEKMEFLALIRRDPQFSRFADAIALTRQWYDAAKADLISHLATHRCWKNQK
jgi:hypothetical protein